MVFRMPILEQEFKEGLTRWVSGVTIVTSRDDGRHCGMTASAFSSVSLHPPLILICASKASETNGVIAKSGCFAVNVLAAGQRELSERFSTEGNEAVRFQGLECSSAITGAPFLPGALASLDCRVTQTLEAGDHVIYVARVEAVEARDGDPLVYHRGAYHELASARHG
jgi:flavin reductase (DIM6/NTAB) family NADH-FMN oxidoreductase RutF